MCSSDLFLPAITDASMVDLQSASAVASGHALVMSERDGYGQTYTLRFSEPGVIEASAGTLAYVYALEPEGFLVVTADTRLAPVIAYSEHGSFSTAEDSPLLDVLKGG